MNQLYQNNKRSFLSWVLILASCIASNTVFSQITVSTESGTNYGALSFVAAATPAVPCAITFVVQNTNAQTVTLKRVDYFCRADQPNNTYKLWYSATSLSNTPTITTPAWTLIATGTPVTGADAIATVLDNFSFDIPAGAQYRFALETANGIGYTGLTGGNPTPNVFTVSGVSLKVGDNQLGGFNVGYGGGFPNPVNVPRFFTGRLLLCTLNTPATAPVLSPDTVVCGGATVPLRVTGGNLNNASAWKWYTGSCGGTLVGTGASINVNPLVSTTYYVRGEGGCASAPGSCGQVSVSVTPAPGNPVVNPPAPICLGDIAHLQINPFTIGTVPTPDSVTITSPTLAIAIPDNITTGASTSLTVPALPAGSQITSIDVTLNMTHTYAGDMIFNLKAPNGAILALDKYLGATGNGGANFVNTIISSLDTASLEFGIAPFTKRFKPDAINDPLGVDVENPDGFESDADSFADLYSVPSGSWTLAMADGGPADFGTLTKWAIKIRYNKFEQIPATAAIWTPGATLYVDEAATIPYDGSTPRLDLYAKPSVTTTYTAVSSSNGCTSQPTTATITVNNPVDLTGQPSGAVICVSGNATARFGVSATGTSPTYQWIAYTGTDSVILLNDANYSGVTTDTLTVTGVDPSWNGYQYKCLVTSVAPCALAILSDAATLTVNPVPNVSLVASPYTNLLPGLTTTLTVSSAPAAASYSWFKNELALPAVTGASFDATIDDQGVYKAAIVDVNGCVNSTNTVVLGDSISSALFIYPNPSTGIFNVSYYSLKGNNSLARILTIYDAKGVLVLKQTYEVAKPYDKMEVDFSRMQKGIYFVHLLDRTGKRIANGKVLIK